ncbi:hypothetical protein [Roseateles depolymerans]|uniref:Putative type I restriction-modification system n=1 Tax=Roseateles depolymerans TaxID=76731 RepID=A0A0U3D129_9BURK|nr:hypothetical protein [Roseateles depolymerans]ALV07318.1 Putative type I restriction-modification system [Roseateles depolymerans]REG22472.1 hypothetical protein DES44_1623 [Roseateles depolymerans]
MATRNAIELMEQQGVNALHLLLRHVNCDSGDIDLRDKRLNDEAVASGMDRIFSAYKLLSGDKLWVITDADRSSTTILLPSDY